MGNPRDEPRQGKAERNLDAEADLDGGQEIIAWVTTPSGTYRPDFAPEPSRQLPHSTHHRETPDAQRPRSAAPLAVVALIHSPAMVS